MNPLLDVDGLTVRYGSRRAQKDTPPTLNAVSLTVGRGEAMGLVGESGSGKTTLGRAVLGLAPVAGGRIEFEGKDLVNLPKAARREIANDLQVVFQDPYGSLNPTFSVGRILAEPLFAAGAVSRGEADERVAEVLRKVHLDPSVASRYPHEFSGGQRQRIAIARAIVRRPKLIVCDEPTSALDLTTQSRIIDLFLELQRDTGVAYLFISHDLGVVRALCHRVAVLRGGTIVETGPGDVITLQPSDPYTRRLLEASPVADPTVQRDHWDPALRRVPDAAVSTAQTS